MFFINYQQFEHLLYEPILKKLLYLFRVFKFYFNA